MIFKYDGLPWKKGENGYNSSSIPPIFFCEWLTVNNRFATVLFHCNKVAVIHAPMNYKGTRLPTLTLSRY